MIPSSALIILGAIAGLGHPDWKVRNRCDDFLRWNYSTVHLAASVCFKSHDAEVQERGRRIWKTWFNSERMTSRKSIKK